MNKQSLWAVVAGAVVAIVATTLVDVVLHIAHVFPPINDPINDALALLATSYRIVIGVAGAWLTARLAPDKPLKHALILGYLGVALCLEAALALYETNAVLVVQPGHLACGTSQLREALARFIALEPTLRSEVQEVIAAGDLALYAGRWTLRGMDPNGHPVVMSGESSDIIRQQRDGRWLIALDNPWGAKILPSR